MRRRGSRTGRRATSSAPEFDREIGVTVGARFLETPAVGSRHFAYLTSLRIPNADPVYLVDEQATSGSFVLQATVAAGTQSAAQQLAPRLTAKLVHRLRLALAGRLHGSPAKLPRPPAPGPPPGGPDLSTLAVGPADFSGTATVTDQGYGPDPSAISTYGIELTPARPFDSVTQSISWYGNANRTTWQGTLFAEVLSFAASDGGTPVEVTAVGNNASGAILPGTDQSGNLISLAFVVMWQGQALDLAIAENPTPNQPADVQALAKAMSTHLNAGLGS